MQNNTLLVKKRENVAVLMINYPEKKNTLSPHLLMELYRTLQEFSRGDEIRAVVIQGPGIEAFSSGYDIGKIPTKEDPAGIHEKLKADPLEMALDSVVNYPYPTIAILNGYTFGGGCELAISCDIRIGADDIKMGMPPRPNGESFMHPRVCSVLSI